MRAEADAAFALAEEESARAEELRARFDASLATLEAAAPPEEEVQRVAKAAQDAAQRVDLDENLTRILIDQQLNDAGWEADTERLDYRKGARPARGRNLAIAEWPTESGPADYALFIGEECVAFVEAKRVRKNVPAAIDQARRYAAGALDQHRAALPARWREFRVPFVFAANGRPFQRQFQEASGIWFCDLRRAQNLRRPLDGWYTPQGLLELKKQDIDAAEERLDRLGFDFDFPLRAYQREAIVAVEKAVRQGQNAALVAMATGTGKTKTCIALVYRLLKAQRFRRVLFLVDRSALGEQAASAFRETRMESLQTFADTFGIKDADEARPDADTRVHIATVQGLVRRILYADEGEALPVDAYDCIVVDECHRGYLLDREMSAAEAEFRDQHDYVSKYRRVLDHFDAVKIGLTATPALHTTEIFGAPVFVYSYREAVLDGYLIDHDPALAIVTELGESGIRYKAGEEVAVYDPRTHNLDLFNTPDELEFDVGEFNKKVITENFNRVVCETLTDYIDPAGPQKTLVFCANDAHADMVTRLMKEAFQAKGFAVEDDAVLKITGAADKPLQLIRRFRNEKNPNVAVTVDLLTTGIDVPAICNLVFLRRVNSRILYEQMLGRATRRCDEIGKEVFRIFDAVDLYRHLEPLNSMKPVAQNPDIGFARLAADIAAHPEHAIAEQAREQLLAKWQRKRRHLNETQEGALTQAGHAPDAFGEFVKTAPLADLAAWCKANATLFAALDRKDDASATPVVIDEHEDRLKQVRPHYGRPDEYLASFARFIEEQGNRIPALAVVAQRPRELTRADLLQLAAALEANGFDEKSLTKAWAQKTNHEVAARILGFVRQAALGDALVPYERRVEAAVDKIQQSRDLTQLQKDWLRRLAKQITANIVLDRTNIDSGPLREQGGYRRANQIFGGHLDELLADLNEAIWQQSA